MKRDFISFALWTREDLSRVFDLTGQVKSALPEGHTPLAKKTAALIFERESLRTRVSFEVGIVQLGGHPIVLQQETIGMATRESVHDIAQVLSQYTDLIIARTMRHQTCVQLAESATVPVINAMTDLLHPCQILSDAFTLQELGKLSAATKLVFLGEGNNIVNSWLEFARKVPLKLVISCPPGYEPHPQILEEAESAGVSAISIVPDPKQAVAGADVVYTDVWPPAREAAGETLRVTTFRPYQVNKALLKLAQKDCVVMHRLPANRGEEITSDVIDGRQSIVLRQANNRLHVQKAAISFVLGSA
jgi:ornithine carbamoyltransferase